MIPSKCFDTSPLSWVDVQKVYREMRSDFSLSIDAQSPIYIYIYKICMFDHNFVADIIMDQPGIGVGKRGACYWSMVTIQGSTRSELPWGLLALCRRSLGNVRNRYAFA